MCGEKSPHWKLDREQVYAPYTDMHYNEPYREMILRQQNYLCICKEELNTSSALHHIDFNKQNDDRLNYIFLCNSCHSKRVETAKDVLRIWDINNKIVMSIVQ